MKRCLYCNALIRKDDKRCPYCSESQYRVIDECLIASEQFERIGEGFRQLGISAREFEIRAKEAMSGMTPNEIRKNMGLWEINNDERDSCK